MKIAFFTDSFFPHVDGVTTYIGVITRALLALGHQVMIVAPRWKGVDIKKVEAFVPGAKNVLVPGVKVFFYPDFKLGTPTTKSAGEVRKFAPDIIHFHTPGFMGFEAALLARLLKVPLITTFHTYYMEPEGLVVLGLKENSVMSRVLQESLWKISEKIHQPCDAVIAPTKYVGKDLKNRWKKTNVQVIPGVVELKSFANHQYRDELRKKYGLSDKEMVFLSSGRLSVEKHYDLLITAFSMILVKYPHARLVFMGDGSVKAGLQYIAKVIGVPKEEVVFALESIQDTVSLYEPIYNDGGDAIYVVDQVKDEKNLAENWLDSLALRESIKKLKGREKNIITLRFFKGKTQMEVADEIGISQAQVSRLEKNALDRIKRSIV
ncbi:MAG: hypothetical protein A2Y24_02355 [Clostridiales bacterium GWE2_32_10]|nr:MAG: hypothetical protein A2Y24_02355 [Clostridiales bacterium GWE2_32_10]